MNAGLLREKMQTHIQDAAMAAKEMPAPIVHVKKRPPQKAGAKFRRPLITSRLGTAR